MCSFETRSTKVTQIHVKNRMENEVNLGCEIQILCPPLWHLNHALRILGKSYFLTDNELGDCEGIDRFIMPRRTFTPRTSVFR